MSNEAKISNLIASDKKELSKFILDLCGFTLDEAGYKPEAYAFYLHIAFRRQSILQKEEWDKICGKVQKHSLGWDNNDEKFRGRVCQFAQAIVDEVRAANQDELPIKLIKTSYLNQLDKARKCSEEAAKFINSTPEKSSESITLSILDPADPTTRYYTDALKAHVNYLDSLLALPFILEKICLKIRDNTPGANFQPSKTAEMLAQALTTLNKGLETSGLSERNKVVSTSLIKVLKIAFAFSNPDLGLDAQLVTSIKGELLPFLDKFFNNYKELEDKKANIYTLYAQSEGAAEATKILLESLNVRFESLQEILNQTILQPIEECNRALTAAGELSSNLQNLAQRDNRVDQLVDIGKAFANFDDLVALCNTVEPSILPAWLQQSNQYYQQLKDTSSQISSVANGVLGNLGAFYNYSLTLIPKTISNYWSSVDPLSQILGPLGCNLLPEEAKKIMAYFAFYDLIKRSGIQDPLESKFFAAYMQEIIKADETLKDKNFCYENYKALEEQLDKKENINQRLNGRLGSFGQADLRASSIEAFSRNDLSSKKELDIFLLIHRLKTLENHFNPKKPVEIFRELKEACEFQPESEIQAHTLFRNHFLNPTLEHLFIRYKQENLIPFLEKILDSKAEKHQGDIHLIRELYVKLKSNDAWSEREWNRFKKTRKTEEGNRFDEISFNHVKGIAKFLPKTNSIDPSVSPFTPEELRQDKVHITVDTLIPLLSHIITLIQAPLAEQSDACLSLEALSTNEKINELCNKKLAYIESINALLNRFRTDLNQTNKLRRHIINLLENPVAVQAELENQIINFCTPNQLIRFAWNVLPANARSKAAVSENFLTNLLTYYFNNTPLKKLLDAEEEYRITLNKNPVPALIKMLNNPLALTNLMPNQEKIMDVLLDKLLMESEKTITSWGVNYIKAAVANITQESLMQLLPYPFLANLAIQALQSQAVQDQIAPLLNSLNVKYKGATEQISAQFKALAKQQLYPLLGIEIQKTIEAGALSYAKNPELANTTEQSSFAMYYLQYRELRQGESQEEIVTFLFSELLKDKTEPKQASLIKDFVDAFKNLDEQLSELPIAADPLEQTKAQLQFLINNLNFSDQDNSSLIKLALVNNLLLLGMDTTEELTAEDKITKLQEQAIQQLSAVLSKIPRQNMEESFIVLSAHQPQELYQSLEPANRRISKKQLERVKASLAQTTKFAEDQIKIRDEMINAKKPFFRESYAAWQYDQSRPARKVALILSRLYETFSFLFLWTAILTPILVGGGLLQALLVSLGIAGAVGATATGTGAIIVGALALLRLSIKLATEIWNRRREFQEIQNNPSLVARIGLTFLLSLKCLGMAVTKTLFTDYLVARISTLLALGPLTGLIRGFRLWPSKTQVTDEKNVLESLKKQLTELNELIDKQLQFLEKKAGTSDQSKAIETKLDALEKAIETTWDQLNKVSANDARYNRDYAEVLVSCEENFAVLKKELALLNTLQQAQIGHSAEMPIQEKAVVLQAQPADKPQPEQLKIDLAAYKKRQETIPPLPATVQQRPSYLSYFWNLFRLTTSPDAVQIESKPPLSDSSFLILPEDQKLSEQELNKLESSFSMCDHSVIILEDSLLSSFLNGLISSFSLEQQEEPALEQKSELDSSQEEQQAYFSSAGSWTPTMFPPSEESKAGFCVSSLNDDIFKGSMA